MDQQTDVILIIFFLFVIAGLSYVVFSYTRTKNYDETEDIAPQNLTMEQEVLKLVNEIRQTGTRCGDVYHTTLPPLTWNDQLANAARAHSKDMSDNNYFSHESQDGRTFADRIRNAGYFPYRTIGENIAQGYETAESVVEGWINSPGHCSNIMNETFVDLGVGYENGYWTQNFGSKLV